MGNPKSSNHNFALILCGGSGTRLWPYSRNLAPKQFIKLIGDKTLFQLTVERIKAFIPLERIFVVTVSNDYAKTILRQVPQLPRSNIIIEPFKRNTAIAHGIGATYIAKIDPNAIIVNLASDHVITDSEAFVSTISDALKVADYSSRIITVGVKPSYPHTGYGYIHASQTWENGLGIKTKQVSAFHEKPKAIQANRFVEEGHYYWNANLYTWKASSYLLSLKKNLPKTWKGLDQIAKAIGTAHEKETIHRVYQMAQNISIDDAISEKEKGMLLIPANFAWTDIGDWKELWTVMKKDKSENVILSDDHSLVVTAETTGSLIKADKRLIVVIDVDDIAVVDTQDALLICKRSQAEAVKKIVEQLKAEKREEYL